MTAKWQVSGFQSAVIGDAMTDLLSRVINGVETAVSWCSSASDPSTGAPVAWGIAEVGRPWLDTGVDGSAAQPVLKVWCQITAGPTYGWRRLRLKKEKRLTTYQAVTAINALSPAVASVAWASYSLASILDTAGVQDTGDVAHLVTSVRLRVRFRSGASEVLGTGATETPYLAFRKTGASEETKIHAQVAAREVEQEIEVSLDTSEQLDFKYEAGTGTPGGTWDVYLTTLKEEV